MAAAASDRRRARSRFQRESSVLKLVPAPAAPPTPAYALLHGTSFAFHVRSLTVSIGKGTKRGIDVHLGNCSSITRKHAELMFNWSVRRWELGVYGKAGVLVNTVPFSMGCPPVLLDSRDLIEVPCDTCNNRTRTTTETTTSADGEVCGAASGAHAFYFLLPKDTPDDERGRPDMTLYQPPARFRLASRPWTNTERERFQRAFLSLGYHRPLEIKRAAGLSKRTIEEVEEFSKSFIVEMSRQATGEEKLYLDTLIEMEELEDTVQQEECLWSWKKLRRSSTSWARRIRSLHFLQEIVRLNESNGRDLLQGLDMAAFEANKPIDWWSLEDDRMLLLGTHRNGYARYDDIRKDEALSFSRDCDDESWPSTDLITRRLKRLLAAGRIALIREQNASHQYQHQQQMDTELLLDDDEDQQHHPQQQAQGGGAAASSSAATGTVSKDWTKKQRSDFLRALMTYGLARSKGDARIDWTLLKRKCHIEAKSDLALTKMYRSFVTQAESTDVDSRAAGGGPGAKTKVRKANSELMTVTVANKFRKRLRLMRLLRTCILPQPKLKRLIKIHAPAVSSTLPDWWIRGSSDLSLLLGVDRHGIGQWAVIFEDPELCWPEGVGRDTSPRSEPLFKRLRSLVHILAPFASKNDTIALPQIVPTVDDDDEDDEGDEDDDEEEEVDVEEEQKGFPMQLERGLELHNLGQVTTQSHLPIGFCTVRELTFSERANDVYRFQCQIDEFPADGKPIFTVTLLEEAESPLLSRDANIDQAWTQALLQLQQRLHLSAALSEPYNGTERFGLCHSTVLQMLGRKTTRRVESPQEHALPLSKRTRRSL